MINSKLRFNCMHTLVVFSPAGLKHTFNITSLIDLANQLQRKIEGCQFSKQQGFLLLLGSRRFFKHLNRVIIFFELSEDNKLSLI